MIAVSDELGDADTADLFTGVSRDADKYLWLLEAHLQGKRSRARANTASIGGHDVRERMELS